jgi:hypothetical protein
VNGSSRLHPGLGTIPPDAHVPAFEGQGGLAEPRILPQKVRAELLVRPDGDLRDAVVRDDEALREERGEDAARDDAKRLAVSKSGVNDRFGGAVRVQADDEAAATYRLPNLGIGLDRFRVKVLSELTKPRLEQVRGEVRLALLPLLEAFLIHLRQKAKHVRFEHAFNVARSRIDEDNVSPVTDAQPRRELPLPAGNVKNQVFLDIVVVSTTTSIVVGFAGSELIGKHLLEPSNEEFGLVVVPRAVPLSLRILQLPAILVRLLNPSMWSGFLIAAHRIGGRHSSIAEAWEFRTLLQ